MSLAAGIQKAIYTALSGHTPLTDQLAGHEYLDDEPAVYAYRPQTLDGGDDTNFPLVTIGEDSVNEWDTDTTLGGDASVQIHVWSRSNSFLELKNIAGAIYDALHYQLPDAEGIDTIGLIMENEEYLVDQDGETLHAAIQYRMYVDRA